MICYLLATRIYPAADACWTRPPNLAHRLFVETFKETLKKELSHFIENEALGTIHWVKKDGYYYYARKLNEGYFALACDMELTLSQLETLTNHLIIRRLKPQLIADNFDNYLENDQIKKLKQDLADTTEIMKSNLGKALARGEGIAALQDKTIELQEAATVFKHNATELNSSCPWFCSIL